MLALASSSPASALSEQLRALALTPEARFRAFARGDVSMRADAAQKPQREGKGVRCGRKPNPNVRAAVEAFLAMPAPIYGDAKRIAKRFGVTYSSMMTALHFERIARAKAAAVSCQLSAVSPQPSALSSQPGAKRLSVRS